MTAKMLSREAFERAKLFLFETARPLEKHLFLHLFAGLPADQAVVELARFANPDGGFGHGLEPDLRCEESSALATSVALQWMGACKLDADHELVQHALRYLLDTFEGAGDASGGSGGGWRIITDRARTGDADKAPWWAALPDATNTGAMFNPTAELLGYLIQWGTGSSEVTSAVEAFLLDHLNQHSDPLESHELLCLMRLAQTPDLPGDLASTVVSRLLRDAPLVAATDPEQWGGYALMPLWLAPTPQHHAAKALGDDLLNQNLDYAIDRQHDHGQWDPFWDWGPDQRAGWELAKADWQGVLTLQTLLTLRAYGRIEPTA
jgi:hypothetical protein